jgi:opacity protein-like surface antigen
MVRHWTLAGATLAVLSAALGAPASLAAQTQDWQYRWFWGAKGGALAYTLPSAGQTFTPQFGGEWLITARRSALYIGFSQSPTQQTDTFRLTSQNAAPQVTFDGMRRIQLAVVVFPTSSGFQPYVGGGFVIETLTNSRITAGSPSAALIQAVQDASSGGFALVMAGIQLRMGSKMALYAHYQGSPQGRDFLMAGSAHAFEAGLRYAFLPAREDDVTTRR